MRKYQLLSAATFVEYDEDGGIIIVCSTCGTRMPFLLPVSINVLTATLEAFRSEHQLGSCSRHALAAEEEQEPKPEPKPKAKPKSKDAADAEKPS